MSDNCEQPLYWPEAMLGEITDQAARTDHSLSYIVQLAWKAAAPEIASSDADRLRGLVRSYAKSAKRKQTLYFPEPMLVAMQDQATRLDSSLSLLSQAAFVLAKPAIEQLPTVNELRSE